MWPHSSGLKYSDGHIQGFICLDFYALMALKFDDGKGLYPKSFPQNRCRPLSPPCKETQRSAAHWEAPGSRHLSSDSTERLTNGQKGVLVEESEINAGF